MRFAIYNKTLVDEKTGELFEKALVVLKDGDVITKWTDFHKYIKSFKNATVHSNKENNETRTKYVVQLLNYVFFDAYHIRKLSDLTVDMAAKFLNDYGLCNLAGDNDETHRKKETVEICVMYIVDFLVEFIRDKNGGCQFEEDDLYRQGEVWSKKRHKHVKTRIPVFEVHYKERPDEHIFRDIPTDAFAIIMNNIYFNHPRILMLAANCAFAGCRPSESCNVRREDSPLGPGILIYYKANKIERIELELRQELLLRSDGVSVGGIKKHRKAKVYTQLIDNWIECYDRFNVFNQGRPYEKDFGPLSTNNLGKAMTYQTFHDEFVQAVRESIPDMLADTNPDVVFYGTLLSNTHITPHILRHWFSVYLVLNGETKGTLMEWRGDKSEESSETYISNKSDIRKKHDQVAESSFNFLNWRATKIESN